MSPPSEAVRKIIHLDMDCFYAAIEERENASLHGKPIAVGGGERRGVVCTCNYVARKFGVRSAMPGFQARRLCPSLIFLPVRFDLYRKESSRIRAMLLAVTPLVEPLSLDEAYLDVTGLDRYAWDIAKELRHQIRTETGLTASAGIAPNKMLAKIASDWRKPDGQFAVTPGDVADFVRELPLRKVWGIGPKSAARFEEEGFRTCGDLQRLSLADLAATHGRWGQELYHLCRGRDDRQVTPDRPRKSLSNESTYPENLPDLEACRNALTPLVEELRDDLAAKAADREVRKIFVKVKFADFQQTTKESVCGTPDLDRFLSLLEEAWQRGRGKPVRLLGTGVRFTEMEDSPWSQGLLPLGDL